MKDSGHQKLKEALVAWDPVAHEQPLDELSVSALRRGTLEELSQDAGERTTPARALALLGAAAAMLALATAAWFGDPPPGAAVVAPVIAALPSTLPAAAELVAEAAPKRIVPRPPRSPAPKSGPERQSRLDFRTASGTRVIWVMRTDFQPLERSDSF